MNNKGWKYGLIKVAIEDEGTDYEEQINLLVELYPPGYPGEYSAFCRARLQSLEEIEQALRDIKRDGINTWFYDNGIFEFKEETEYKHYEWDWTLKEVENVQNT